MLLLQSHATVVRANERDVRLLRIVRPFQITEWRIQVHAQVLVIILPDPRGLDVVLEARLDHRILRDFAHVRYAELENLPRNRVLLDQRVVA